MVVDDDPAIRKLVELRFQLDDFETLSTGEPEDAVRLAASERPDALVLDVMMPKMDGLEVARRLKGDAETRSIPIILLSAKAQQADVQAGQATGADEYLTKPFDPLELLQRVGALIDRA